MTRDQERLVGVHPALVTLVLEHLLPAMAALKHPMFVTAGLRTEAEQQALYAQGRTAPGAIVTNADGLHKRSNHQAKADGFGHAVDLAFVGQDPWSSTHPWSLFGLLAQHLGLQWGGAWKSLIDKPHIELPG